MGVRFPPDTFMTRYLICYALVPRHPSEYAQSTLRNVVVAEHPFDWLAAEQRHCLKAREIDRADPVIVSWQTLDLADVEALKRTSAVPQRTVPRC